MGEVYRARDSKLKRQVAIKVLPAAFANDSERMSRFQREAQVLALLNHPNIAAIYGLEESNGLRALVMELVEGPTLAERIGRRAMPMEEALPIAKQIAEALDYAHTKGIIHRDLKPANVKVTADGNVKVLDFGLAKALERPAAAPGDPSISPTFTLEGTQEGVILGTAAYMAPEQARGAVLDKRADIWSFGVVLYEILTGKRPFAGATVSDTLASVLKTEPDLRRVPPQARRLLERCLEKDPKRRLRDIGEAQYLLEAPPQAVRASRGSYWWKIAAAVLALTLVIALWNIWRAPRPAAHPFMRLTADLGGEIATDAPNGPAFAISADLSHLVYVSRDSNWKTHLSVRSLDRSNSTVLDGTEGAVSPFFSPDGRSIGFFADDKLKRIPVDGGTAIALSDDPSPSEGTWAEDGTIFFSSRGLLLSIPSSGGTARVVTEHRPGDLGHRPAQLLPGGQAFLFSASGSYVPGYGFDVEAIKTGARKTLVKGAYSGRYLPTSKTSGYLLYAQGSTIFARRMDPERLELTGPAVPVLQDVAGWPLYALSQFALTPSGNFVYLSSGDTPDRLSLCWLDAAGNLQRLPASPARYLNLSPSPDAKRIALLISSGSGTNLWVYDWASDRMTQLTFQSGPLDQQGGRMAYPAWTPDGQHLVFAVNGQDLEGPGMYWVRADGAAGVRRLFEGKGLSAYSFSPDGKYLAYTDWSHGYEIRTVSLDLSNPEVPKMGTPELFLSSNLGVFVPNFSPDGRWIAYSSFETRPPQLSVRPFHASGPKAGARWQVSTAGIGGSSSWSPRRELFYQAMDMRIYVAPYSVQGDAFVRGTPRLWSEKAPPIQGGAPYLSMMPDGKRFIVALSPSSVEPPKQLTILLNFGDWLRQRFPP